MIVGDIIRYILTRDGVELYRGMTQQYTDDAAILPYQSYVYVLTACTQAGCTDSPQVQLIITIFTLRMYSSDVSFLFGNYFTSADGKLEKTSLHILIS